MKRKQASTVHCNISRRFTTIGVKTPQCTNAVKYPRSLQDVITWRATWPRLPSFILVLNQTGQTRVDWWEPKVTEGDRGWTDHTHTSHASNNQFCRHCAVSSVPTKTHTHTCAHTDAHECCGQLSEVVREGCAAGRPIGGQRRGCHCAQGRVRVRDEVFYLCPKGGTCTHTNVLHVLQLLNLLLEREYKENPSERQQEHFCLCLGSNFQSWQMWSCPVGRCRHANCHCLHESFFTDQQLGNNEPNIHCGASQVSKAAL